MMLYAISFDNYGKLVSSLINSYDVYGPVKDRVSSYELLK